MRIALCDDKEIIMEVLRDYLLGHMEDVPEIHMFTDASKLLCECEDNIFYDLVFLDIELGNMNGIDVAFKLKQAHPEIMLVYMTAYHQYVFEIFETQPFDFLRKPFQDSEIDRILHRVSEQGQMCTTLAFEVGRGIQHIELRKIYYLESDKRKVRVVTAQGTYEYYERLDIVEKKLSELSNIFWRINQSTIINSNYIIDFDADCITMKGALSAFRITRKFQKEIQVKLMERAKRHGRIGK